MATRKTKRAPAQRTVEVTGFEVRPIVIVRDAAGKVISNGGLQQTITIMQALFGRTFTDVAYELQEKLQETLDNPPKPMV